MLRFDAKKHPAFKSIYGLKLSISFLSKRKNFTDKMADDLRKKGINIYLASFKYFSEQNKLAKMKVTIYIIGIYNN